MSPRARIGVEHLEHRHTPANFGTPWPDGSHLTLSFSPDGTQIGGTPSSLGDTLNSIGVSTPSPDVLGAFQSWAAAANINIGLVTDGGQSFGVGRATQGDPRFGDIRIGGRPLGSDVLAVTAPYNLYDSHSGEVVLNTAAPFAVGGGSGTADPFTVLLHEAGHSVGLGDGQDPTSAMYETYAGTRTGLSPGDVAAIQALYGPRVPDRYEGEGGNNTRAAATPYTGPVSAELTTPADVDVYKFTPGLLNTGNRISLRAAGISLVTARVELLDSSGQVIAAGSSTDPTANDVTITTGGLNPFSTYYVRVSAARPDEFGVGSYKLAISESTLLSPVFDLLGTVLSGIGLNHSLASATSLRSSTPAVGSATEFHANGTFDSAGDSDYYAIVVPPSQDGTPVNLLTTVWGADGAEPNPWVSVMDETGTPLSLQVISANGNATIVQARELQPGRTYFLRVSSDTGDTGQYEVAADLRAELVAFDLGATGGLDSDPLAAYSLNLKNSGEIHFVLQTDGPAGATTALTIWDGAGNVLSRVTVPTGRGRSVDLFLPAGTSYVTVSGISPGVSYRLGVSIVTDPIGAEETDPTTSAGGPGDGGSSSSGSTATTSTSGASLDPCPDQPYWC